MYVIWSLISKSSGQATADTPENDGRQSLYHDRFQVDKKPVGDPEFDEHGLDLEPASIGTTRAHGFGT